MSEDLMQVTFIIKLKDKTIELDEDEAKDLFIKLQKYYGSLVNPYTPPPGTFPETLKDWVWCSTNSINK